MEGPHTLEWWCEGPTGVVVGGLHRSDGGRAPQEWWWEGPTGVVVGGPHTPEWWWAPPVLLYCTSARVISGFPSCPLSSLRHHHKAYHMNNFLMLQLFRFILLSLAFVHRVLFIRIWNGPLMVVCRSFMVCHGPVMVLLVRNGSLRSTHGFLLVRNGSLWSMVLYWSLMVRHGSI